MKQYTAMLSNNELKTAFLTKRMNLPTQDEARAVAEWEEIKATNQPFPDLVGNECIGGVDYADLKDFCSVGLLFKKDGKRIFTEGAQSVVSIDTQINLNEENVGIVRKSGYWTIKGRVNYLQNNEEMYKDFSIKAIPPKEMINYDAHIISWNELKMSIPETIDAFTSPNNDIIGIATHTHLLIYNIIDGSLNNMPLAKIKLPENSSIIMSEWSVGRYPTIWQNEVIKNKGKKIEYKID